MTLPPKKRNQVIEIFSVTIVTNSFVDNTKLRCHQLVTASKIKNSSEQFLSKCKFMGCAFLNIWGEVGEATASYTQRVLLGLNSRLSLAIL